MMSFLTNKPSIWRRPRVNRTCTVMFAIVCLINDTFSLHSQKKKYSNITVGSTEMLPEMPVILTWDSVVSKNQNIQCGSLTCKMTNDRQTHREYPVLGILFYASEFALTGLPLPRRPGHVWSVIHEESPKNNEWLFTTPGAMKLFNLTSTFQRESHYPITTMWLHDERDLSSTEYMVPIEKKNQLRKEGLAPIIFVHNDCNAPSDRSHYMRLLQKYIPIDSYGPCEHNKDFPSVNLTFKTPLGMYPQLSPEFLHFVAQYKFAFAFENAVCDDYVTEKFWRPLKVGVVPLVFGSPRIEDVVPRTMSAIHLSRYTSVEEVAKYINFLDHNDENYLWFTGFKREGISNHHLTSMLQARDWGVGRPFPTFFQGFECFVCKKLHALTSQIKSGDPTELWQGDDSHFNCPKPRRFDDQGRYVLEASKAYFPYDYAKYYLRSLQYHIDNNIEADKYAIHNYKQHLDRLDRREL